MNKDKEAKPHGLEMATHEDADGIARGNERAAASNIANDDVFYIVQQQQDTAVEQYTELQRGKESIHGPSGDVN